MYRKQIKKLLVITFTVTLLLGGIGGAYAFSKTANVPRDKSNSLSGNSMYVGYDYGTWRPNDDAWLKAEIYGTSYKKSYCLAISGNSSESDSGPRAIVEIPGVDFFDDGSYAETVNGLGDLHLYVK
ncbi:hypothetical protein [Levyella massiliensis]|uniref:hypothetical protein n=1 Tax=Levyella massiliensis TaxID=938289 RepID=UPI00036BE56F|nr:hypothetical protein [Levyella massiliensis]